MLASDDAFLALIQAVMPTLLAFAFGYVRIAAVLEMFPLFTTINLRGSMRATVALVLAIPLVPVIEPQIAQMPDATVLRLMLIGVKELAVGATIGILLAVPFWGVQAAGDIIDFSRGASAANLADPVNANEISIMGTVLLYAALAIFVISGGVTAVIDLVYDSYAAFPVTAFLPEPGDALVPALGRMFENLLLVAVIVSGPLMLVMIMIDLSLVFSSRIARQIQATEFAIILKGLATAAFIPLYAVFLEEYLVDDWRELLQFARDFLTLYGEGGP
ncbi:type III secretion system export apparatus subunit SctT [Salinarimonas chemoclinalis]|uniref:type III secretion system export apparatus subunit SctT n=1 Tax=Salinarimonas chemoclinalis TaxID=3241599 RepID=UPI0035562658